MTEQGHLSVLSVIRIFVFGGEIIEDSANDISPLL